MYGLFAVDKRPLSHLSTGTAERTFNSGRGEGGLETSRQRREFVFFWGGGTGGILSQRRLKFRSSEMVLSTFSMRYF